jgi:hypothetical protein
MVGEFELHGREALTVLPLGEKWIEKYWRGKVETILGTKNI